MSSVEPLRKCIEISFMEVQNEMFRTKNDIHNATKPYRRCRTSSINYFICCCFDVIEMALRKILILVVEFTFSIINDE